LDEPVLVERRKHVIRVVPKRCRDHARRPLLQREVGDVLPGDHLCAGLARFGADAACRDRIEELFLADAEQLHDFRSAVHGLPSRKEFDDPFRIGVEGGKSARRSLQGTCSYLDPTRFS
jgi:hypothetical protein